ncbi:MAG: VWA domain-containing protein [Gemmataceae bacterium]|nr:VWA domain-containing protein [Gemmataceae bacterium]
MRGHPLLFGLFLSLLTLPLAAQQPLPYRIEFNPTQDVKLLDYDENKNPGLFVNVRFTITLEGNQFADLPGVDYKIVIEEDGRELGRVDVPKPKQVEELSAMLVIDTSGSMAEGNRMVQAKTAAQEFIQRLPTRADCGLILFDHEIREPTLVPTKDRPPLLERIAAATPRGGTAYLDATDRAIEILAKTPPGRERAVVLMTDGVDLNSTRPLALVMDHARRHKVRVHTIGIGEPGKFEPVRTVLVLDHSGSMKPPADDVDKISKMEALHRAAKRFVTIMPTSGFATIIPFSSEVSRPRPFTNDKEDLINRISKLQPSGETALFDAVYAAVGTLEADGSPGRRSVVAMTDGIDNSSRRRVDEVIERAQEAKIKLYLLGFGRPGELDAKTMEHMARATDGRYYHAKNEKDLLQIFESLSIKLHDDGIDEPALRSLAEQTGGKYYHVKDADQLRLILEQVSESLAKQYEVTVRSKQEKRDGTIRKISLKLVRRSDGAASTAAGGTVQAVEETVTSHESGVQVSGVVVADLNHLVYLFLLLALTFLIALPAVLRRLAGSSGS